jgi:hypothetical protein
MLFLSYTCPGLFNLGVFLECESLARCLRSITWNAGSLPVHALAPVLCSPWPQPCARSGAWRGRLRGCPPPFGLLLDAATPSTPSARAASRDGWGTAVVRPPLRESRLAVLLQRSGIKEEAAALGRNGGQPRSGSNTVDLLPYIAEETPPTCSRTKQRQARDKRTTACHRSGYIRQTKLCTGRAANSFAPCPWCCAAARPRCPRAWEF